MEEVKEKEYFVAHKVLEDRRFVNSVGHLEYESQPILLRTLQRTLQLTLGLARETDQLTTILRIYDGGRRSGM